MADKKDKKDKETDEKPVSQENPSEEEKRKEKVYQSHGDYDPA